MGVLSSNRLEALARVCPTISAGILSADLLHLGDQVTRLQSAGVELLHIDVMDGCFVPQMTVGAPFVKALKEAPMLKDAHLMIDQPLHKVAAFVEAGADMVTVHIESQPAHIHRVLQEIRLSAISLSRDVIRGIALNPGTSIEAIEPLMEEIDMVLVLAINPGWGGQKLNPGSRKRLERIKAMIQSSGRKILTCLDGGVTRDNITEIGKWGADLVVTGSAIFERNAVEENAAFMLQALKAGRQQ